MGGGPSGGGGDPTGNAMTNRDIARAEQNRNEREQKEAKKRADKERAKMAKTGVQDPYEFTRLAENLQARELEKKAEKGQIKVPVPTLGSVAINTIGSLAMQQQARELRRG